MEAGNRVVSPAKTDAYDADSLALLSTGPNTDRHPLVSFRANERGGCTGGVPRRTADGSVSRLLARDDSGIDDSRG